MQQQPYDRRRVRIRNYVANAIEDAPRGTQARLARHLKAPVQTVNKWAQKSTCPSEQNWAGIEEYFGWPTGTIAGIGGMAEQRLSDLEAAILAAEDLTEDGRDVVLRVYLALRIETAATAPPAHPGSSSPSG